MYKSPLIEFQRHNPDYYMCKFCATHIALAEDFIFYHTPGPNLTGGAFSKAVNVYVEGDPQLFKRINSQIFSDIYCKQCYSAFGLQYVQVDKNQTLVKNGMVLLNMKMLVMRHGNEYLDGETMLPLSSDPYLYMCKRCKNNIALATDVRGYTVEFVGQQTITSIVFNKVVDVGTIPELARLRRVGPHSFAIVFCANCSFFLGWKMIASDDPSFAAAVQSEMAQLDINCLLRSHGNNIIAAETMIPPYT